MKQSEDETQVYQDEDYVLDEGGHCVMKLPEGIVKISTEVSEQKTGETIKTPIYFTGFFSSETPQSLANFPDLFKKLEFLNLELEILKKENLEIRQKFDEYINKSEVIEIRELPDSKIEKKILKFLKKHREEEVYPSDIAFTYNLDTKKVFEICQKLKKEGKII